jgi:hypothetical protein
MRKAASITIPMPVLCELVWVLKPIDGMAMADIASAIRGRSLGKNPFCRMARRIHPGPQFGEGR